MNAKIQPTPTLPLELVERIVDLAGRESTQTCMLVSRQFHAGALRNIYQHQSLNLYARSDVLSKQYSRLFGDQDQFVVGGSRGRHVRELSILFVGTWPRLGSGFGSNVKFEEDWLLRLMEAFATRTGLKTLFVLGDRFEDKWDTLPLKAREGIRRLIKLPSLSHLVLKDVDGFPVDILHGNKALRIVHLNECGDVTNASDHAVKLPKVTRLLSCGLTPVQNGFFLPRLQVLTACHSTPEEQQDSWIRIDHAHEVLECITIFDKEKTCLGPRMPPALPTNMKLSYFPKLRSLNYSYEGGSWSTASDYRVLRDIVPFFETVVPLHKFSTLGLQFSLDQWEDNLSEEFWFERKDLVATDPSWEALDTILASDCYPNLRDVYIYVKIFNSILDKLGWEIIQEEYPTYTGEKKAVAEGIRRDILGHFVKAREREIDVFVQVCADF